MGRLRPQSPAGVHLQHSLLTCGDYMRVDCILANCRAVPLPPPLTPEQRALAYEAIFPDVTIENFDELNIAAPSGADNAELVFMPDAETAGFLRRTFPGIRLHATLEPLCRYFALSGSRSIGARLYACFRRDMVDIMVFDRSCLLLANSFAVAEAADAAYYIMACAGQRGNTNNPPTIMASGNSPLRAATTDILRQCGANVMPAIFPSTVFSASTDAMDAPFDLIAMALCE